MNCDDVHEALYRNCEFRGSWIRAQSGANLVIYWNSKNNPVIEIMPNKITECKLEQRETIVHFSANESELVIQDSAMLVRQMKTDDLPGCFLKNVQT